MNVGIKIKELRTEKGLSQQELANKCGMSKNSIYNYENGKRSPRSEDLYKIAEALGVPSYDLLFDNEQLSREVKCLEKIDQVIAPYGYKINGDESQGYMWIEGHDKQVEISTSDLKELEKAIEFTIELKLKELESKTKRR